MSPAANEAASYSVRDGIAVITLDNPPVNAVEAESRRGRRFEAIQLLLRAVDDRHRVIAGPAQQFRDHGSDFARTYDNDVFHVVPVLSAIFDWKPCEW